MTGVKFGKPVASTVKQTTSHTMLRMPLTDPLVQDLTLEDRQYLSYFASDVCKDLVVYDNLDKHPFRGLIPLTCEYPALLQIMIANSAMRLSNVLSTPSGINVTPQISAKSLPLTRYSTVLSSHTMSQALRAKQRGLCLLRDALASRGEMPPDVLLAVILLFLGFELLYSGQDDWSHHTMGARKLIEDLLVTHGDTETPISPLRKFLISNCIVYVNMDSIITRHESLTRRSFDIIGSALASPTSFENATPSRDTALSLLQDAEGNHCASFPTLLLQVMQRVAQLYRGSQHSEHDSFGHCSVEKQTRLLLRTAQSFDPLTWATNIQHHSPTSDLLHRMHVASAHRAAVCIYLSRLLISSDPDARPGQSLDPLVSEAIHHMSHIRQCDPLFAATTWPAFVAGAETNDVQQRDWITERFQELWQGEPWGTGRSASDVLRGIWSDKNERIVHGEHGSARDSADWISNLKNAGVDWLII
ncbi:hypothetical protein LTR95_006604 [Oleoguttula sp. CCFEE 5521]